MRLIKLPSSARVSPSTSPPAFLSLLLSLVLFAFLWVDVVSGAAVSEKLQSGSPTRDAVGTLKPSNLATSVSGGSTTPAQINTEHPKTTTSISSQNPVPTLTSDTISQDTGMFPILPSNKHSSLFPYCLYTTMSGQTSYITRETTLYGSR